VMKGQRRESVLATIVMILVFSVNMMVIEAYICNGKIQTINIKRESSQAKLLT
jgi:hypothetical protein